MDHALMVEEACDSSSACEHGVWFELGVRSFNHSLAKKRPRIDVYGENNKDLEWVEASERAFACITGGNKCG